MSKNYPTEIFDEYSLDFFKGCLTSKRSLLNKEYAEIYYVEYFIELKEKVLVKFVRKLSSYGGQE